MPPSFATYDPALGYRVGLRTFPWYNGYEKGASIVLRPCGSMKPCLVISFGEARNSNGIFVETWEQALEPFNIPTIEERENKALSFARVSFDCGDIGEAASYIYGLMEAYYVNYEVNHSLPSHEGA
jgi:hypothetical protein